MGDDWPFADEELDPIYQHAEKRMGVAGARRPVALDPRGKPYPLPPLPVNCNPTPLQRFAAAAGIAAWSTPSATLSVACDGRSECQRCETCYPVCPSGAKYSADFTWDALVKAGKITLVTETLVRRLLADPKTNRILRATGNFTGGMGA